MPFGRRVYGRSDRPCGGEFRNKKNKRGSLGLVFKAS